LLEKRKKRNANMLLPLHKFVDGVVGLEGLSRGPGFVFLQDCGAFDAAWKDALLRYPCVAGVFEATQHECITEWLNNGAREVVIRGGVEDVAVIGSQLPKERLVYFVEDLDSLKGVLGMDSVGGYVVGDLSHLDVLEKSNKSKIYMMLEECEDIGGYHKRGIDIVSSSVDIGQGLISCLRTDRPDGLYTTVVTDEYGVALGLVYSSKESLLASLECGRGVYWSRSRNNLWRKGDTSGAYQELVRIEFDCDCDAVRFTVRQRGDPASFCHLGTRTCWGNSGGLPHLFQTLQSRKANAPEGSYTKRLFDDKALLRNKLLEEAQEVIEAIEEQDPNHVAEEVADLAYFLFTACCAGGATMEDVNRQLDMRSLKVKRRPGNAKEYRIKAAEAALNKESNF